MQVYFYQNRINVKGWKREAILWTPRRIKAGQFFVEKGCAKFIKNTFKYFNTIDLVVQLLRLQRT